MSLKQFSCFPYSRNNTRIFFTPSNFVYTLEENMEYFYFMQVFSHSGIGYELMIQGFFFFTQEQIHVFTVKSIFEITKINLVSESLNSLININKLIVTTENLVFKIFQV